MSVSQHTYNTPSGGQPFVNVPGDYQYIFDLCFFQAVKYIIITEWAKILIIIFVIAIIYYWLILPVNWIQSFAEVGYDNLLNNKNGKFNKATYIREIQRKKKIGEIPPVYPNGWFALLESNSLQSGEVKYVSALGEHFAVFRTINGNVSVLDAYCPHLGANLGVNGVVHGNCLECPFHGWRFREDGKCISIPYSDKVPDTAVTKKWISQEVNSFIFVWYHAEDANPDWFIDQVPEIKSKSWIYRGRNEFTINCHIQEIPENGCDIAHLEGIHSVSMFSGSNSLSSPKRFIPWLISLLFKHVWTAQWEKHSEENYKSVGYIEHEMKLLQKISLIHLDVKVYQIGPAYVELHIESSFGRIIIFQTVLPEGPLMQKVIHRIYCPWYLSILATFVLIGETIMFKRDMAIWNHKKYLSKPFLVKGDGKIMQFRRWYSQFFSENSKKFTFREENGIDW